VQVGNQKIQMCFIRLFSLGFFSPGNKRSVFVIFKYKVGHKSVSPTTKFDSVILKAAKNHMSSFVRIHYCSTRCPLVFAQGFICDLQIFHKDKF